MKITTINEFAKFLKENIDTAAEARNIFMGILQESTIQQIESNFKVEYGIVNNDGESYYIQLKNQQGQIIDRIVYRPSGEMNDGPNEWWTANSTAGEETLSFETYNKLVEWFNNKYETHLPILNL